MRRLGAACTDFDTVRLTLWSAVWLAVHTLVITQWQSLFEQKLDASDNDLVLGVAYGLAACCALLQGARWVELALLYAIDVALCVAPLVGAASLYGLARGTTRLPLYSAFVAYHCCFEFMQPFIIVQISRRLTSDQFGVVFGAGTALGLALQVVIQALLQTDATLRASQHNKFLFFAAIVGVLGALSLALSLVRALVTRQRAARRRTRPSVVDERTGLVSSGGEISARYRIIRSTIPTDDWSE